MWLSKLTHVQECTCTYTRVRTHAQTHVHAHTRALILIVTSHFCLKKMGLVSTSEADLISCLFLVPQIEGWASPQALENFLQLEPDEDMQMSLSVQMDEVCLYVMKIPRLSQLSVSLLMLWGSARCFTVVCGIDVSDHCPDQLTSSPFCMAAVCQSWSRNSSVPISASLGLVPSAPRSGSHIYLKAK